MRRCLVVVAVVVVSSLAAGCALERLPRERPARLLVGANTRDLAGSPASVALRQASPTQEAVPLGAYTASVHFTMKLRRFLYGGMEVEAGQLDTRGSNFGGAYGVLGAEHATRLFSIGVEVASGWRGLRYRSGADDLHAYIAEPRVRGQLRIGEQLSLGAMAGATLGERGSWMGGIYLGVHSAAFGE
jgi:hypothetical protein